MSNECPKMPTSIEEKLQTLLFMARVLTAPTYDIHLHEITHPTMHIVPSLSVWLKMATAMNQQGVFLSFCHHLETVSCDISRIACTHHVAAMETVQNHLLAEPCHIVIGLECFDKLDPCRLRQNQGSIWIKTLTFLSLGKPNCFHNAYPVAVSDKNIDHDLIDKFHTSKMLVQ